MLIRFYLRKILNYSRDVTAKYFDNRYQNSEISFENLQRQVNHSINFIYINIVNILIHFPFSS